MKKEYCFIFTVMVLLLNVSCDGCGSDNRTDGNLPSVIPFWGDYVEFKPLEKCADLPINGCGNTVYLINKGKHTFSIKYEETNITDGTSNVFVDTITITGNESVQFKCNRICPPGAPTTTTNYKILKGHFLN